MTGSTATDAPFLDIDVPMKAIVTSAGENFCSIKFDSNASRSGIEDTILPGKIMLVQPGQGIHRPVRAPQQYVASHAFGLERTA
ncbi:hypothetical protein ACQR18_07215 [Bradyrhizobium oligotrophicum]|uniref:hypothetical protein n=1 Tax=Bradyrhizobium oligotrophicum TaxID=44255 RepID=UPI003EBED65D